MVAEHLSNAIPAHARVGIVGAGAMGSGIAQVAAIAGHPVSIFDTRPGASETAIRNAVEGIGKLTAKGRIPPEQAASARASLHPAQSLDQLRDCALIIEAIVEDLSVKRTLFRDLEAIVPDTSILATNTSSLSITALAAHLHHPERVAGMHFFNPAPLMPLVEIIGGLATAPHIADTLYATASRWGKTPVRARSTPGFIVNRVARSFYAEALRLLEERAGDCATIDAILRESGGFRMGPFELMDLIGHDVNYAVTRSVFEAFFSDPRFTPSLLQKELVDANYLGRKTGRGFYLYDAQHPAPAPSTLPPQPPPPTITLFGNSPVASALRERLTNAGLSVDHQPAAPDARLASASSVTLYLTDGRTATQRAADLDARNLILLDLASDYASAKRLCIASSAQAEPNALAAAAGLLQAAGYAVSAIDDAPGLVVMRTVAALANEAADAVHQGVCTATDCDLAMRLGVNYPRGPLAWADLLGATQILAVLDHLAAVYTQPRYRASPLLRRHALTNTPFHLPTTGAPLQ